jgi:hypothetical protein
MKILFQPLLLLIAGATQIELARQVRYLQGQPCVFWKEELLSFQIPPNALHQQMIVQKPATVELDTEVFPLAESPHDHMPCQLSSRKVASG